jgi:HSP20 family molecular chaperone IbpA
VYEALRCSGPISNSLKEEFMTTRLSVFDSPLFLGFDHFEKTIDRLRKTASEGYPPYNIEQIGENGLRITLAVAGFSMEDLDIEQEKNQLTIRGRQKEEEGRVFLHRGIAGRQFQRSYVLADGIEILGAYLDNGLLHIDMRRVEPESNARKIPIAGGQTLNGSKAIDIDTKNNPS